MPLNTNGAASRVAAKFANVTGDRQAAFDPSWITTIAQVLTTLLPMLQQCMEARKAKTAAANPTARQLRVVKNEVRRHLTFRDMRQHGDKLVQAILAAGADATPAEIQELYDAV